MQPEQQINNSTTQQVSAIVHSIRGTLWLYYDQLVTAIQNLPRLNQVLIESNQLITTLNESAQSLSEGLRLTSQKLDMQQQVLDKLTEQLVGLDTEFNNNLASINTQIAALSQKHAELSERQIQTENANRLFTQQLPQQLNEYKAMTDDVLGNLGEEIIDDIISNLPAEPEDLAKHESQNGANPIIPKSPLEEQASSTGADSPPIPVKVQSEHLQDNTGSMLLAPPSEPSLEHPEEILEHLHPTSFGASLKHTTPQFDAIRENEARANEIRAAVLEDVLQKSPGGTMLRLQSGYLPLDKYVYDQFQQTVHQYAGSRNLARY